MSKSLFNRVIKEWPSLKTSARFDGEFIVIEGMCSDDADWMIKDINSIVFDEFEGRIKDCEYMVCGEYNYFSCRSIAETAKTVA